MSEHCPSCGTEVAAGRRGLHAVGSGETSPAVEDSVADAAGRRFDGDSGVRQCFGIGPDVQPDDERYKAGRARYVAAEKCWAADQAKSGGDLGVAGPLLEKQRREAEALNQDLAKAAGGAVHRTQAPDLKAIEAAARKRWAEDAGCRANWGVRPDAPLDDPFVMDRLAAFIRAEVKWVTDRYNEQVARENERPGHLRIDLPQQ